MYPHLCRDRLAQGVYDEAKLLYERAVAIHEKAVGPDHPDLAVSLNNLGHLLQEMVRVFRCWNALLIPCAQGGCDEAIELYTKALRIVENTFGQGHPRVASVLNNLTNAYISEVLQKLQNILTITQGKSRAVKPTPPLALNDKTVDDHTLSAEHDLGNADDESMLKVELNRENLDRAGVPEQLASMVYKCVIEGEDDVESVTFKKLLEVLKMLDEASKHIPMTIGAIGDEACVPSPLSVACALGKLNMVRALIKSGFALGVLDDSNRSPFMYAARYGKLNVVEYLWGKYNRELSGAFRATDTSGNNALGMRRKMLMKHEHLIFAIQDSSPDGTDAYIDPTVQFLKNTCKFPEGRYHASSRCSSRFKDEGASTIFAQIEAKNFANLTLRPA